MPDPIPNRLLVVDDEPDVCAYIEDVARDAGFETERVLDGASFPQRYLAFAPSAVVLDLNLPGADGIELLRFLAAQKSKAKILLISGGDPRVLASARRLGGDLGLEAVGALQKPLGVEELEAFLASAAGKEAIVTQAELAAALEHGEFVLHYQPKARLRGGATPSYEIDGCEALLRWHHPRHGLITPNAFIPLAEEKGLIGSLTDYEFREAVTQAASWHREGLMLNVSVNLSPHLLTDLAIPERLHALVRENGVDPARITVEITETAAMADVTTATEILTRLRLKGFGLSIDDFGTGYSSLVELYRMPFNELKIDRCFITELDSDPEAQKIVRVIALLGHELGLTLCAEGVESEAAMTRLCTEGCERAQGYLIGRPVSAKELTERLRRTREHGGNRA